jgi:glucokinase
MAEGVRKILYNHSVRSEEVAGVGIGSPGPLSRKTGRIQAMPNVPGMENFPLRDRVAEELNFPATLENDANAAAYGEFLAGAGRGCRDMVMLTLGTGVGSGIVHDGEIIHGVHEMGGELGHMIVRPGGRQCGCGQRGCLEQYASARNLAWYGEQRIRAESPDSVLRGCLDRRGNIEARDVHEAYLAGDAFAREIWLELCEHLAYGCINICRTFDPDRIVLAGGLTQAGDDLLQPTLEAFREQHWKISEVCTEITVANLGNDAGPIGAAGVAWRQYFQEHPEYVPRIQI